MSAVESQSRQSRSQQLGMRPGTEPYYTIAEQTETRLVLQSKPKGNARVGYQFMARGAVFALVALFALCSGFFALTQGIEGAFGSVVLATLCSGVLGGLGFSSLIGGWGITNTSNSITVDVDAQTIIYHQRSKVFRQVKERTQQLTFDQIAQVRLRKQETNIPGLFQQRRVITALEMVTHTQAVWFIDSATDPATLMPTATTLAAVLGKELESTDSHNST